MRSKNLIKLDENSFSRSVLKPLKNMHKKMKSENFILNPLGDRNWRQMYYHSIFQLFEFLNARFARTCDIFMAERNSKQSKRITNQMKGSIGVLIQYCVNVNCGCMNLYNFYAKIMRYQVLSS